MSNRVEMKTCEFTMGSTEYRIRPAVKTDGVTVQFRRRGGPGKRWHFYMQAGDAATYPRLEDALENIYRVQSQLASGFKSN